MQRSKYIPAIDGLRAAAILIVLSSHLWRDGPIPGGIGVTLFFFISGFLITGLLIDEIEATGSVNLPAFYIRRLRRLAPALLTMIAIVSGICLFFGRWSGQEFAASLLYLMNYYEISGAPMLIPIGPLWSLAIEEHFYLLFPLLIASAWRFRDRLLYALIAACVAVLLWRCILVANDASDLRTYLGTDTRIDSILFGCILVIAMRLGFRLDWLAERSALIASATLLVASMLVRSQAFRETIRYTIQGVAFAPPFFFLLTKKSMAKRLLETAPMVWIGKISYSLYLWHFPILVMCEKTIPSHSLQIVVATVLSFAAAACSYYLVETPLRSKSHGIQLKTAQQSAL